MNMATNDTAKNDIRYKNDFLLRMTNFDAINAMIKKMADSNIVLDLLLYSIII